MEIVCCIMFILFLSPLTIFLSVWLIKKNIPCFKWKSWLGLKICHKINTFSIILTRIVQHCTVDCINLEQLNWT